MKQFLFSILFCTFCFASSAQSPLSALLPFPQTVTVNSDKRPYTINNKSTIASNSPQLQFAVQVLQQMFDRHFGQEIPIAQQGNIQLLIDDNIQGNEHYILNVNRKAITIQGHTPQAILYGIATLRQVLLGDEVATYNNRIAALTIDDAPRYPFRALMLDPARHFLSVDEIKFFIDQMYLYKYNTLQLHLTDDQGWRIQIMSHPELTEQGTKNREFYTQQEIRELIIFAAERGIAILPEIDVPGHTKALLASHPELRCTPDSSHADDLDQCLVCAANPKVYPILQDVIREISALFPYPSIHLGGDEATIEKNWAHCIHCRALRERLGYSTTPQLMNCFFGSILPTIKECGKQAILWCELDNKWMPADNYLFDYPHDVTLVTWRNGLTPKCNELTARHGNKLIMAPGEHCYIDYPQYRNDLPERNNWGMPITTLEQSYKLDPSYGLSPDDDRHIQGVMGTLWGEAINDVNRACYMAFPRALAIAEAGWSPMAQRSWQGFIERLYPNLDDMTRRGIPFRVPFEISIKRFPVEK